MPDSTESPHPPAGATLQIGAWTVEPALNQVTGGGHIVKLEPKSMALLLYLADRQGHVVGREALLGAVWPGSVVGDDSLTQVILKLRKALGDERGKAAYIQTISKAGYRLVAPVVTLQTPAAAPPPPVERKRHRLWLGAAGVAALALAAYAWIDRVGAGVGSPAAMRLTNLGTQSTALPTLTVKPFESLGADAQAGWLAAGITEDLATDLSKASGLSVIAAVRPLGAHADEPTDAPPARYVVSGSVQRIGARLRVRVHLTDSQTGHQLWSERFDRAPADFFTAQDELAPKILQIVPAKVTEAELRRVSRRHTPSLEAYEYFQRGQQALRARHPAENEAARELFRRAIALDATFARAYAGLARTYAADYRQQWTTDDAAALNHAFSLAQTAHEMEPAVPETDWVLAYVHMQRREHKQALQQLETALRQYPSFADAYALMGAVETHLGRPGRGIALIRTALRLNPEANILYFVTLGRAYLFLGDLEQSRINLDRALLRSPRHLEARVYLAALNELAGDRAGALWEAEEIRALQPAFSSRRWLEGNPMTDGAQKRKLGQALQALGL
jgi:DNA-binding winged helix-turn-helix (wHTH) protein/TolB-like protein